MIQDSLFVRAGAATAALVAAVGLGALFLPAPPPPPPPPASPVGLSSTTDGKHFMRLNTVCTCLTRGSSLAMVMRKRCLACAQNAFREPAQHTGANSREVEGSGSGAGQGC